MMFSLISQKNISSLFILIILSVLVLNAHSQYTKNCHYSCLYCGSPYYSHCIICEDSFTLSPIKNADNIKQYYNTLEEQPWGPCIGTLPETNVLGIVLVIISIISLIYFKNRTIFFITSSLQSLALFSFIQIGYTKPISYMLQSLEYFMFVSSLNRQNRQIKLEIFDDSRYRMWEFLNSYGFGANFTPIFIMSIICFVVALFVPVARHFSKKESSLWSICNCIKLQKVFTYLEISSLVTFFFLIQQSILIILIGLFLDDNFSKQSGNIAMVVIYFLMLAFIIVDLCMKNFDLFSNKIGEQIQILKKTVAPLFIVLPINAIIAVAAFILVLSLVSIIIAKTSSKTKKRTYFHEKLIKREVKYRIVELIITILIIVYYLVEKYVQNYKASLAIGIINVIAISIFFLCFFIQAVIELFGKFIIKQSQQLYENGGFQLSSLRQSKMLEETIENFQTTDEGIMDMIFFGRNKQQENGENIKQQKRPKKTNIHLTMDQLNESVSNNQQEEKIQGFTPSVSPNHRQLERILKSKTSRTPKNDRSSRFKLHKTYETERPQQNDIEKVQATKISAREEQQFQQINDTSDLASNKMPKTTQRQLEYMQPIKIVPQDSFQQEKSPRYNKLPLQHDTLTKITEKPSTKSHILNIFHSEEQNQDDFNSVSQNQKNVFDNHGNQQLPVKNETKDFRAVKKQNANENGDKERIDSTKGK